MDPVVKSRARYERLVLMFVCYISNFLGLGEKKWKRICKHFKIKNFKTY